MPSIRILGGSRKQKSIQSPHHEGLRPTTHRVRQTAFDILVHRFYKERIGQNETFSGLRILDVCAGLGGYGFEALSRGAAYATFIEQVPALAKQLSSVARSWNMMDRVRVFTNAWPMPLGPGHQPYDVIFFDPPYAQEDASMITMISACAAWMVPRGLLLVESNHALPEIEGFSCAFVRTIGKKHLSFLQLIVKEGPSEESSSDATGPKAESNAEANTEQHVEESSSEGKDANAGSNTDSKIEVNTEQAIEKCSSTKGPVDAKKPSQAWGSLILGEIFGGILMDIMCFFD